MHLRYSPYSEIITFQFIQNDVTNEFIIFNLSICLRFRIHEHLWNSANPADINGVQSLVKQSLNWMLSKRIISIQEAVHEIDRMDLVICSDMITNVSLMSCTKLQQQRNSKEKPKDLVYCYATRKDHEDLSLEQYFYKVWCKKPFMKGVDKDSGRPINRILVPKGLKCKPVHPITFDYARGMILMHRPWSLSNPSPTHTSNKQKTIRIFKEMLDNKEVPSSVMTEYMRAVKYATEQKLEVIAKQGVIDGDDNIDEMDDDEKEQHLSFMVANQFTDGPPPELIGSQVVDIGDKHDWTETPYSGTRRITCNGEEYCSLLRKHHKEGNTSSHATVTEIPTRSDGRNYDINELSMEQRVIVLAVVDTVVKFLTNDEEYKPLRATITGIGGGGKSLVINTIISIIRKMTDVNDTVKVAAPSGCAAHNVNGTTLHTLLGLKVQTPYAQPDQETRKQLENKLHHLLVLMVDEVSMLTTQVTYGAEDHLRSCAYNGHNNKEIYGGVPVVLFFGDYCQLPPPDKNGAIHGFDKYYQQGELKQPTTVTAKNKARQISEFEGAKLLVGTMTEHVFKLTKNFRTKDEGDRELLDRMRIGEQTEEDAMRLMRLHVRHYPAKFVDDISNDPKTLFAFATQQERHKKNMEMLIKTQKKNKQPIARLNCIYQSNKGRTVNASHLRGKNTIFKLDICVGAQVCLEIANINPNAGLYVGSIGRVVEIVYGDGHTVGPNGDKTVLSHLPKYIVVDFPQFKPPQGIEPWDRNNPTESATAHTA